MKEQHAMSENEPQLSEEKHLTLEETKPSAPEDLRALVEKNIRWSQAVYEQNKKILRRMTIMTIGNYLRLALIVIPLILAAIYLPTLINQYLGVYQEIFSGNKSGNAIDLQQLMSQFSGQDIEALLKQYQR